jgi:beta-phosphoglucomutase-like phosphatase (HAD superfamily)
VLRAVLFDLDGTLVDSERQNAESVARALARRGRALSDEERELVIGHGWREIDGGIA